MKFCTFCTAAKIADKYQITEWVPPLDKGHDNLNKNYADGLKEYSNA